MFRRHLALRLSRTPLTGAAIGIFVTLAAVSAFHVPAQGPAWFLSRGYLWTALFAALAWSGPAILAARPVNDVRDVAVTALLFAVLATTTVPPMFWAERLGEIGNTSALYRLATLIPFAGICGAVMVHVPPWRRTYGDGVLWVMVQIGAYWAMVA